LGSLVATTVWVVWSTSARAQAGNDASTDYSATATTNKPFPATSREDVTASGTTITTDDRPLALETVSEALREAPGTRTQQLGGFGSFSGLALRGADTGQTSVLLGNLPLDSIDEGAFDFSLLPLGMFESVTVYRGGAPAWLGSGSIGGVVQLIPRRARDNQLRASSGVGSFGRYHLALDTRVAPSTTPGFTLQSHVALDGATNNFPFRDPGGALISGDEHDRHTQNAQAHQGNMLVHASAPLGGGELEFLWMGVGRSAGIPGPQRSPSPNAHRQLARTNAALGYTFHGTLHGDRRYRLQALIGAGYQVNRVSDRGEIGITYFAETDDRWSNEFARVAGAVDVTRFLELTAVASARADHLAPENKLALRAPPRASLRTSETGTVELRAHGSIGGFASELRGSARVQVTQASIQATRNMDSNVIDVHAVTPTFRLAAVTAPAHWLSFGASVVSGQRMPTFGELFGDRAFLQPNPDLKPERSVGGDLSATIIGHSGRLCAQSELRAFHLAIDDFITYLRSSRFDARAENIGFVTINGVEIGSKLGYGEHAAFTVSATAMDSRNALGHQAPNRPNLVLYTRPEVSLNVGSWLGRATLFADLSVVSFNYTDAANLNAIPGRQWVGLGAALRMLDGQIELQLRASNLLDQQSEDLNGFALPRRALMASLTIEEKLK
jgi:iron complex outermembrane receptor protein